MNGQEERTTPRQTATPMPDGGVRETLDSIVVSPMPNAPFSLALQTEWVRVLSDGGTATLVNERHIARDSKGRIFEERCGLVAKDFKDKSIVTAIQIADPINHTLYTCMMDGRHVCDLTEYTDTARVVQEVRPKETRTLTLPNSAGAVSTDDLGEGTIEGVSVVGTRVRTAYNPGHFSGNDNVMTVEREFWYAPQLGINLLSKINNPLFGTQTFTATNLVRSQPDAKLFALPDGFRVVDQRSPKPPTVRRPE